MRSIKWRIIAMYLGLVLIVMIVTGSYILISMQNTEIDKARDQLELYAQKVSEQVVESYDEADFQTGLEQFTRTSSSDSQIQGNIINEYCETVASTAVSQPPFPSYNNSVVMMAISGETGFDESREDPETDTTWICYASPALTINGEVKYVVYARMNASAMQESLAQTTQTIIVAVFLALVLAVLMAYVFAKTLTGPIHQLTVKAKLLAEGDLKQTVEVYSEDEIGQLAESFNYMASELNKTVGEAFREKNKLEAILHNMTDGVISFDKNGNISHANTVAAEMLEVDKLDFTLDTFTRKYDLELDEQGRDVEDGMAVQLQYTFPVGEKYINASFSPYFNETEEIEGIVVVLQDITKQKKLDNMRKEFVANVSHEMRTPLTTIKSYTETLMYGALEEKDMAMEFLNIINTETDRMSFLVRDLLQLSRFDNKQVQFKFSKVYINEFISENVRQNKIHAENKKQNLILELWPDDNAYVVADRDRVNQVINNITTNAIKYSPEGATIRIYVTEDKTYYKINVSDTGMGISKEDLPRIFERFYRVDKARSRAMGGTGLGLAIAKEIMEGHDGKLTAESEYGKGTTMTMWFMKNQDNKINFDHDDFE
ncbi:MAG TPA: cell wall metabolism sensor histidine kinase WalK [Firmicutes bacterium]|nr:cell wall metabolism sensor histidine kinase WalK [Bacillota bacterium]